VVRGHLLRGFMGGLVMLRVGYDFLGKLRRNPRTSLGATALCGLAILRPVFSRSHFVPHYTLSARCDITTQGINSRG
jgi:hypothetical protein